MKYCKIRYISVNHLRILWRWIAKKTKPKYLLIFRKDSLWDSQSDIYVIYNTSRRCICPDRSNVSSTRPLPLFVSQTIFIFLFLVMLLLNINVALISSLKCGMCVFSSSELSAQTRPCFHLFFFFSSCRSRSISSRWHTVKRDLFSAACFLHSSLRVGAQGKPLREYKTHLWNCPQILRVFQVRHLDSFTSPFMLEIWFHHGN